MVKLICHGCGRTASTDSPPKEFVCKVCGARNVVPDGDGFGPEPLGCLPPKGFEWSLPAGRKSDPLGNTIYITAQGTEMSKKEFIEAFGCDPDIMLAAMRKLGINGVEGFKNLSTLGKRRKP